MHSLDLLCIASAEGYFTRLNPAWEAALGWTLEELQANPFIALVHPDDRASTLTEVRKLNEGEPTIQFENRYRCRDGAYRWLQWSAKELAGSGQIYAVARDVTAQKRLETEVLAATDRERERLGRELHDGLCQNLAGIAALSTRLSRKLAAQSRPESADAATITRFINETTRHARDLARTESPLHLSRTGLAPALQGLGANVQALHGLPCEFLCNRPSVRLGTETEAHLYRIAQEALSNAITHGRAKHIKLSLVTTRGKCTLSVEDDGVGIPDGTSASTGSGLHTMAYRTRAIGGWLHVRALSPHGTLVSCEVPLPPESVEQKSHGQGKARTKTTRPKKNPHRR